MQEEQKEESVFQYNFSKRSGFKAKTMRLNNPQDFKRCFQNGKRVKNRAFVLHFVENGGLPARFGVNIAKSKIKKAVERNKIKRVAREAFRRKHLEGLDIVLILRNEKNFNQSECSILINEVFDSLKKNELLTNKNN